MAVPISAAAIVTVCAVGAAAPAARAGTLPPDTANLVEQLLPTSVRIVAVHYAKHVPHDPQDHRLYDKISEDGSGFIIDPSGVVITNHHVIAKSEYIDVYLHDNTRLRARLIYSAPIDMVLLKVRARKPLPAIAWGDSDKMRQGDSVIAIGNPLGVGISVSAGVISALDRNIGETAAAIHGGGNFDNMLQTDAALNHGNSGGPLFNLAGQLIGINTALISPTSASAGLGFAIPSRDAQFVLDQYHRYGRVRPGYIGATVQQMSQDLAATANLPGPPHGVIVDSVKPDGPASKAGLEPGEIILTIRGVPINDPRDYARAVVATPFDTTQPVVVWQNGHEVTLQVHFIEGPDSQPQAEAQAEAQSDSDGSKDKLRPLDAATVGVTLAPLTPQLREQFDVPGEEPGVIVTHVVPLGIAYDRGVQAGDVIAEVQGTKIASSDDLRQAVAAARAAKLRYARVLLRQGERLRWVAMPLFADADE